MDLMRKHGWLIGLTVIVIPFIANFLLQIPAFTDIVGNNTDWLSFWGDYLGAVISATVAFLILKVQYDQNKKENTNNRNLQISVLRYQFEKENVANLISVSARLVASLNPEEAKIYFPKFGVAPSLCMEKLQKLIVEVHSCYEHFCMVFNDEKYIEDFNKVTVLVNDYLEVLGDLNNLTLMLCENENMNARDLLNDTHKMTYMSDKMRIIINENANCSLAFTPSIFWNIANERLKGISKLPMDVHDILESYIRNEEQRIKEILTSEN